MNMMTKVATHNPDKAAAPKPGEHFLDENGNPSDRSGADLTKAQPIKQVAACIKNQRTRGHRHNAAYRLIEGLKASGIWVHAGWSASLRQVRDGTDKEGISLQIGFPCDGQEFLRTERYDVLKPLLEDLRSEVIEVMLELGTFSDLRPYASGEVAVREIIAADARTKLVDGEIGVALPLGQPQWENDRVNGWPLRRASQRFSVSLHSHREEIGKIIEAEGTHSGGGYSLKAREVKHVR